VNNVFSIGPYNIEAPTVLAPMAGVTDLPFRKLCYRMGAGLVVGEMLTSDTNLWHTRKSRHRLRHDDEVQPRAIQIAGGDAEMLAHAARQTYELGAQIIDINMGCPAKKVCKKAAGSALMRDESLVQDILNSVVQAVPVPVTLKMRTGWSPEHKNAVTIARMAEDAGIVSLAVHGRTRECKYHGRVEYDTISQVVEAVDIPVIANGDISTPEKAKEVLAYTGANAVMLGRAAQGRPWLFNEVNHYLATGEHLDPLTRAKQLSILLEHVSALHQFYGELMGTRIARKHVGWYLAPFNLDRKIIKLFNQVDCASEQLRKIEAIVLALGHDGEEVTA